MISAARYQDNKPSSLPFSTFVRLKPCWVQLNSWQFLHSQPNPIRPCGPRRIAWMNSGPCLSPPQYAKEYVGVVAAVVVVVVVLRVPRLGVSCLKFCGVWVSLL